MGWSGGNEALRLKIAGKGIILAQFFYFWLMIIYFEERYSVFFLFSVGIVVP